MILYDIILGAAQGAVRPGLFSCMVCISLEQLYTKETKRKTQTKENDKSKTQTKEMHIWTGFDHGLSFKSQPCESRNPVRSNITITNITNITTTIY